MRIDVIIEYNKEKSEVTFSSKATNFSETRPANIGLFQKIGKENIEAEMIEFVGEDSEGIKIIQEEFNKEPTRKDCVLRIVNPFESSTFEPIPAFKMIDFFIRYIVATFYPKTWTLRRLTPFLIKYDVVIKIPNYAFFDVRKKEQFEKMIGKNWNYKVI